MVSISITKPIVRNSSPAYMTFSLPCDEDTARMQFEARHGRKPEEVKEHKGKLLMLGPVPEVELFADQITTPYEDLCEEVDYQQHLRDKGAING